MDVRILPVKSGAHPVPAENSLPTKIRRGAEAESDQPRRTDAGRKRYHKRLSPYPDLNAIEYEDSQTVWYRRCATNGKQ
jgi:hypothetical protein